MRTLKKSLALVLALVMLLGLGVVGASADNALDNYTDADEIGDAYLEAVGVLTGLGIVDGMTETTIVPQATYTRAQAAKIITTMVLGVNGAKSCVASYAPFDDVAANHWAAGYIAFCKEQGIIDGVTDTTFDPEGTLTGYQWAKMLLAAVGFNANNELEGSSWSLNTARIGREVGLFDGDLAGADHTPLRREQAMLYAFNTLSAVRQVTWTTNGNNYVYDITFGNGGYIWADGTSQTLGEYVFDLESAEGIIVDNEGMGAKYTYVNTDGKYSNSPKADLLAVSADTGLDLVYHAVRVWYIDGKTNTSVYVNDLAKTTVYECMNMAKGQEEMEKVDKNNDVAKTTLGNNGVAYETYLIDNTAIDDADYAYVTLKADLSKVTYVNNTAETLTVDGETAKFDDIHTDISDITARTDVVYVKVTENLDNGTAWYIYPVTTTQGVVSRIDKEDGKVISVTLTNGTVLPLSALRELGIFDVETYVIGRNYTFVLDTHGDILGATNSEARDLYAFTGDYKWTNEYGSYWSSRVKVAQFVEVATGNVVDFPVITTEGDELVYETGRGNYYDLTAEPNTDGLYVATNVTETMSVYAGEYLVESNSTEFTKATGKVEVDNLNVYYDANTTFIIATGTGDNISVKSYNGLSALLSAYNMSSATSLTLTTPAFVASATGTKDDYYASVVFAFEDNIVIDSNYVFVPYDVDVDDWDYVDGDSDTYQVHYTGVGYLNGDPVDEMFVPNNLVTGLSDPVLKRGFYTYRYEDGVVSLTGKVANVANGCFYGAPTSMHYSGSSWTLNDEDVASDVKVIDLRSPLNYTKIEDMDALYKGFNNQGNFTGADEELTVGCTFNAAGEINFIYVVNEGWYNTVTFAVDKNSLSNWTVESAVAKDETVSETKYEITLSNDKIELTEGATYTGVDYTVKHGNKDAVVRENWGSATVKNGKLVVTVTLTPQELEDTVVTITDIPVSVGTALADGKNGVDVYATPTTATLGQNVKLSIDVKSTGTYQFAQYTFDYDINGTTGKSPVAAVANNTVTFTVDYVVNDDVVVTITGWNGSNP